MWLRGAPLSPSDAALRVAWCTSPYGGTTQTQRHIHVTHTVCVKGRDCRLQNMSPSPSFFFFKHDADQSLYLPLRTHLNTRSPRRYEVSLVEDRRAQVCLGLVLHYPIASPRQATLPCLSIFPSHLFQHRFVQ